ncbi:MAG: MFS transporter [Chloroflexi bacterium]|nr:MFS transporter [Chloroflexota bacterium]
MRLRSPGAAGVLFCAFTALFWGSLYVYVPILPLHAKSLGAGPAMLGAVISAYGLTQLLFRIPLGLWVDLVGRKKPFIVAGAILTIVGAVGLEWSPSPMFLFLARALTGVAAATWVASTVLYASYFPPQQTTRAMAFLSFSTQLSLGLAGLAGGFLADALGVHAAFLAGAGLGALGLLLLLPAPEHSSQSSQRLSFGRFRRIGTTPLLLIVSLVSILNQYGLFATTFGFLPVYGQQLGASRSVIGLLVTVTQLATTLGSLGAILLAERLGYRRTLLVGALLAGAATAVVPLVHSVQFLGLTQMVTGLGRGILGPVLFTLVLRSAPPQDRATAMGIYQALYSVGMFVGPLLSGGIAQAWGVGPVFVVAGFVALAGGAVGSLRVIPAR